MTARALVAAACLLGFVLATGCSKREPPSSPAVVAAKVALAPVVAVASAGAGVGIAWRHAANDADIAAAFAAARADVKPVFVYWGAGWCPPCNQVKATIFNRQDFIERSRAFVPVYIDGDSPGAQRLAARFHVSGYPTMLLFSPSGEEVTRLPGEVDPARYTEVLNLGMNAARPVKALLAEALAHADGLRPNDWRLLAFYSFDTDQQQLVAKGHLASTLARLAAACPVDLPAAAMRLRLKALAASDEKAPLRIDARTRESVQALLADEKASREEADELVNSAPEIVRALSPRASAARRRLLVAFDSALLRLEGDTTLSRADRVQALISRVELARIDPPEGDARASSTAALPPLSAALVADARETAVRADREITDGYERQAVITAAAYMLERAGLSRESDALLEANLARSHSPYYLMSELAGNAKRRGDKSAALRWSREAFEKSQGPATRLQWGASYVSALIELSPADEPSIEAAASRVWAEATAQPDAFYGRSARSLQRVASRLQGWGAGGRHGAALARLHGRLAALCARAGHGDADRAACAGWLATAPKKASA